MTIHLQYLNIHFKKMSSVFLGRLFFFLKCPSPAHILSHQRKRLHCRNCLLFLLLSFIYHFLLLLLQLVLYKENGEPNLKKKKKLSLVAISPDTHTFYTHVLTLCILSMITLVFLFFLGGLSSIIKIIKKRTVTMTTVPGTRSVERGRCPAAGKKK